MLARLRTLILQDPKVILTKGYIFEKNTSQQLYELRDILENSHGKISQMLEEQKQMTGIANMKIKYNKVFGYFIEVSKGKTEMVPEHYIRRQTLTNAERYTTPVLQEFEQKVMNAEANLVDLEIKMFDELLEFCDDFLLKTLELSDLIGRVDVLCSHAECVNRYEFCKPEICVESVIEIEGGFHPVVKNIIPYGEFIENDLSLLDQKFMVLTGPNMGGKSTFLRQNAIIVLLASIGAFVPARKAKIGLCDGIFTRVGASDNLSKGQSTFMVEMEETSEILRIATDRSFVIIDELGRGTSSLDGIAISSSVVKFMNKEIGCRTLFATHFFEIASLVDGLTGTGNLCVKVTHDSQGKPVFSRKIVSGSIDKSYGVEVAEMAGMPAEVVEASKHYLNAIETGSAQVVKGSYGGENLGITRVGQEGSLDSVKTESFGVNLATGLGSTMVIDEERLGVSDLSRVDLPGVDFPGVDAGVSDLSGADVEEKLSKDNTACNSFHQSVKNKDVLESVTAENNRFLEAENLDMKEGLNVVVKADNDRPQRSLFAVSPEEKTEIAKRELQKAKNMIHLEKHGLKIIETIKAININSLTPIQAMLKLNELIDFAHKKVRTKD
jgi:DNA mismatch repair ATPase MutS